MSTLIPKQDKRTNGRNNLPVISKIPETQLWEIWHTYTTPEWVEKRANHDAIVPFTECWLWKAEHSSGYPVRSLGHGKPKLRMHMLSIWTKTRRQPSSRQVVSHLCHRKNCINPDHLVIESIVDNNARMKCPRGFQDDRGVVWNLCPHHPRCLREDLEQRFVPEKEFDPLWFS